MTRRPFLSRGRRSSRISLFIGIVMLTVVGPVWAGQETARTVPAPPAARAPSDLQSRLDALQARVDALEKDAAVADIRRELNAVRDDLAESKRLVQERAPAAPLSPDAWKTLGGAAALFMAAWAFVNLLREGSRRREVMLNTAAALVEARVKLGEKTTQEAINEEFNAQMTQLQSLLVENAGGLLSLSGLLQRLFRSRAGKQGNG